MALPELGPELGSAAPWAGQPEVHIDEGTVPLPDGGAAAPGMMTWSTGDDGCLMDFADVGRFGVSCGRYIKYQRAPSVDDELLRLFLLGSVLGVLWHQRGRLPLHAGAVAVGERAWAFAGPSGAGKSSLVVTLAASGAGYLCDDVCVTDVADAGLARCWPGLARLRVSPQMCRQLDLARDAPLDPFGKHALAPPWPRPAQALPLGGIVVLETGEGSELDLVRLGPVDALAVLLAHTYRSEYLPRQRRAPHFAQCVTLVRTVPVYRLTRPWGAERLRSDALHLLAWLADQPT